MAARWVDKNIAAMKKMIFTRYGKIAAMALLGLSCSTERIKEPPQPVAATTTLVLSPITRTDAMATNDELAIKSIRLVVFRSQSQPGGGGGMVVNQFKNSDLATPFSVTVPVGKIDIYLITNELLGWNLGATDLTTATLKSKSFDWVNYPVVNTSYPIPMFRSYEGVSIDQDGNMAWNGAPFTLSGTGSASVERTIAKVLVNIKFDNGGLPLTITSLNIKNIPRISWLYPTRNEYIATTDFFDGANVSPVIDSGENLLAGKPNRTYTCYLPEYIITQPYWRTNINLIAANRSFSIVLGDGMGTHDKAYMDATNDLNALCITRNTCYIVNVLSITGDMPVVFSAAVTDWDKTVVPVQ